MELPRGRREDGGEDDPHGHDREHRRDEHDERAARLPASDEDSKDEDGAGDECERVREHADGARHSGEQRVSARKEHEPGHRQAEREEERRLPPGEVHDHDGCQHPGGGPVGHAPLVTQVEVEENGQKAAG